MLLQVRIQSFLLLKLVPTGPIEGVEIEGHTISYPSGYLDKNLPFVELHFFPPKATKAYKFLERCNTV